MLELDWDKTGDRITIGVGDARYHYAYDSASNVIGLLDEAGHLVEGHHVRTKVRNFWTIHEKMDQGYRIVDIGSGRGNAHDFEATLRARDG